MMGTAKHVGRVGALAVEPGIRNIRRTATRMSVTIGAAVMVIATVVPVSTASASSAPCTDTHVTCALILGGTTAPTPDDTYIDIVKNQYIAPTHPGRDIDYVAVTTPEESWPITGILRLVGAALGDPRVFGPGSPAWPDEPWWKLSGLFDLTLDRSIQVGVADLEAAITEHPNDHLVIYGLSQGAVVANVEKKKLSERYPAGTIAPDIDFVLQGDENLPNGGLLSRFPGLYIPVLEWSFNGAAPTDTQFDTVEISREYDGFTDFPLYPLNVVADLNAVLGILFLHTKSFDVSLPANPTKSPAYQGKYGDTSYYLFQTQDLPLFAPLRMLGVPESLIDVVEPFFRVLVDLGYDRSIAPWEPTPARLIPPLDPGKVATDLLNAIGEGVNNALALVGSPAPLSIPAPVTPPAPATETAKADMSSQVMSSSTPTQTQQVTIDANVDRNPAGDVDGNGERTRQVTSTDTARTQLESSAPAGASESSITATPEPSASASTPKLAKPAGRPAKPRSAVHDSLGATERPRGFPHRSKDPATSTTGTTAADPATTAGSSLAAPAPAAPASAAGNSRAGDSSGGDAGGVN